MDEENFRNNEGDNMKNNVTVVLKADFHCDGCAAKVIKCIRSYDGVDAVTVGEGQKISVVGMVDPAKLRDRVERKTHKKVELISPQPKKDGGASNVQKKPKEKEFPVTTAVFKLTLHCDGCVHKIYRAVVKTKGYADMSIDRQKDLVTVTGAIDVKALADVLSKLMKRRVDIVQNRRVDGEKKEETGGGGGGEWRSGGNNKMQMQMQAQLIPNMFMIGDQIHYSPYPVYECHAPQYFSDENPNACRVM